MDNIADKRPIKVYYTSKDTIQDLKRKIAIYLSNQNPHFSYTEEDLRFWKPDFTYQNISSFVSFLESKDLSNGEAITFPTELGEKGKDGNPQAVNDEDCEANVEVNTGVEFPGFQMDIFFKSKIVDFQKTKRSFNSIEYMVVEQAQKNAGVEKPRFIFKYDRNTAELGKCENCFNENFLKVKCPCGKVSYCNAECRQSDENYHMKTCEYLNKIDLKTINFSKVDTNPALGKQGLSNLGNTCYMNSALQCLSNMDILREYFLTETFKAEVNFENVMGSKGEVVTRFGELLNQLWNK